MPDRKQVLKGLLKRLHEGADPEQIKQECQTKLGDVPPSEMARVEEELVREGLPREELQKFCDIHLALLKESLEKKEPLAPAGHPIHILMEEHKMLLQLADELKSLAKMMKASKDSASTGDKIEQLSHIVKHLRDSDSHYIREENVLFPSLEKHGIKEPPAIMWMEHDRIRDIKKIVYRIVDNSKIKASEDFVGQLDEVALALAEMLSSHFYKENNILFPAALEVIDESEWLEIRRQFDEMGYCCFTPEPAKVAFGVTEKPAVKSKAKGIVSFETGNLSREQIEAIFNTLPVDVTFVDKDDTVRYFSQSKDRIFPRAKAIIGLKVQNCHPQKSVHVVNQILKDFRSGKKDVAQFWINLQGKLVHIRYFAVRQGGEYRGCLEVTQDITEIKKIKGERRLLEY
jgi:PAS domain S-box-containing protein